MPRVIEVTGRACPGPLVVLSRELKQMAAGECVEVVSDDSAFAEDLDAWCQYSGHTLRSMKNELGIIRAVVVKGG